ncbi:MAG TPA: Bax inhibitor-1/YccA family protein [Candidatus Stercorousia faecigallinarum]|nr:Bax inhibitor-1/YccA family protein [Candidatus Stercorousia faecigallinarum]
MSNPILNEDRFSSQERILDGEPMTIEGTVSKIFMLFACLLAGAAISVYSLFTTPSLVPVMMIGGGIIGFVLVIATSFNISIAKYTAAPYALMEGLVLGAFSAFFEAQWHGIILQAILGTFAVLFVMLMLYKARMIQYTDRFAAVLKTSLLSIMVIYLIQFAASFFGRGIPLIWGAGPVGIGFSLVVVVVAAMALIQDFFFIEDASRNMLDKNYEWYGAMGLMITLVWLYTEILRLLAKLNSRN